MNITFALKAFFGSGKKPSHVLKHFLLDDAKLTATLTFADSTKKTLPAVARGPNGVFPLAINIADVPDVSAGGVTHKLTIASMTVEFAVTIPFGGKSFPLLNITQQFSLTPTASNNDTNIDYTLLPFAWTHSTGGALRTANARTHPLLDVTKIATNRIEINALIVDITDLWDHLHRKNRNYQIYKDLTDTTKVTFKVFAHLGGMSFIWFAIVPTYIKTSKSISPHVFMSPSDLRDEQNIADEKRYLVVDNLQVFAGDAGKTPDGDTLLFTYLLPPVDDTQIATLSPKNLTKPDLESFVKTRFRNVVNFERLASTNELEPLHWNISAGFERAFYGLGKKNPQQILLMPQTFGNDKERRMENTKGLKDITDTIIDVISTNTNLIQLPPTELVTKDKIILSAYSESGIDLWITSEVNIDAIKAIIGIEPNKVNPRGSKGPNGQATIPKLLNKKIQVFLIGNTFTGNHWYRPEIDSSLIKKIRFFPDDAKILEYPPNPDSNDFVKFRVGRIMDPTKDPFLLANEQAIVTEFANKTPPVTGKKLLKKIFKDINNSYDWNRVYSTFYNHHFALTGGRIMKLADPVDFYNKPVSYQTFFQEAVEEIG